jgi:lipopolysaccharide/colanic/teichoic acid biosynthesis glycosyltransferase
MAKRAFDIVCAALGLVFLSPVFAVIAWLITRDSPGGVFFRQERIGLGGKPFRIYKFRTMRPAAEGRGQLTVSNDDRITKIGGLLRRTKCDELPQLINVLLGDMSLVGPRPEVPRYVACYTEQQRAKIFTVRPGITDLASIEFSKENEMLDASKDPEATYIKEILPIKIGYYERYVDQRSLPYDVWIILKTFGRILGLS